MDTQVLKCIICLNITTDYNNKHLRSSSRDISVNLPGCKVIGACSHACPANTQWRYLVNNWAIPAYISIEGINHLDTYASLYRICPQYTGWYCYFGHRCYV